MGKNQWLTVADLLEILKDMPQDAKIVVNNTGLFVEGIYYATRDSISLWKNDYEDQVEIGTNYNTRAWGYDDE